MVDHSPPEPTTTEEALAINAKIGGGCIVSYDGLEVLLPLRDIQEAVAALQDGDRQRVMISVRQAIKRALPSVKSGSASQATAMTLAQDICIWFANEVVEGRETLGMN